MASGSFHHRRGWSICPLFGHHAQRDCPRHGGQLSFSGRQKCISKNGGRLVVVPRETPLSRATYRKHASGHSKLVRW